jgi:citrate synthase
VVIRSRITALGDDRPFYRGRDATELATTFTFEAVAEWLWSGNPQTLARSYAASWVAPEAGVAAGRAAQSGLPAGVLPLERLQVIVPALAAADPRRNNLEPAAVLDMGRALIAGLVDCLPDAGTGNHSTEDGLIAARLWTKLSPLPRQPALVDVLRAALVIVADHELAASTLAARVAASVRADPYCAVIAGMGTMSGTLHGGASLGAESMLAEADAASNNTRTDTTERVRELIGLRLRRGERIPGFGHAVYRPADGRATALLEHLRAAVGAHPTLVVADALIAEARRRHVPEPNIDLALAVLTRVAGMAVGCGEAIFAIARTAGWLAHILEEYENRTPLRLRAVYLGPS